MHVVDVSFLATWSRAIRDDPAPEVRSRYVLADSLVSFVSVVVVLTFLHDTEIAMSASRSSLDLNRSTKAR